MSVNEGGRRRILLQNRPLRDTPIAATTRSPRRTTMFDPDEDEPDLPLAEAILDRVESVLIAAERDSRPVEINPFRSHLFEAFVTTEGAGLLNDGPEGLNADGLCRRLGERWGLTDAMRDSVEKQQQLTSPHRAKMRLLWSVARMWMEWQYAWDRWPEFHQE